MTEDFVPEGFVAVDEGAFWKWVMGTRRNIHPHPRGNPNEHGCYVTAWEDLSSRALLGKSIKNPPLYCIRKDMP